MSLIEEALRKRQAAAHAARRSVPTPPRDIPQGEERRLVGDVTRRRHVDHDALRQAGLLPPASEERGITQQFRSIKRPLIHRAFQSEPAGVSTDAARRSIMVTSALPGDGKTFTALNLALSLALERDHSVILIDGDVPKPNITELFQARNEPGLLDLLEDSDARAESVILATDVPGLSLLPVGRPAANATELLSSARMRSIILELEALDPQGIVLVDSPPVLLTSEARVLAGLFSQVVMVVRASGTPQQAVLDAIKILGDGPHVNLVLNQALHVGGGGYYGYGSNYGYGDDAQKDASR